MFSESRRQGRSHIIPFPTDLVLVLSIGKAWKITSIFLIAKA
jgi:hypothetical protein